MDRIETIDDFVTACRKSGMALMLLDARGHHLLRAVHGQHLCPVCELARLLCGIRLRNSQHAEAARVVRMPVSLAKEIVGAADQSSWHSADVRAKLMSLVAA